MPEYIHPEIPETKENGDRVYKVCCEKCGSTGCAACNNEGFIRIIFNKRGERIR